MKLLLPLFLFLSFISDAQNKLVVSNDKCYNKDTLILYVGISNNLQLYIDGSAFDTTLYKDFLIKPGAYTINSQKKNGNVCVADITVAKTGSFSFNFSKGGKDTSITAYARNIPTPYAALDRARKLVITKQALLQYKGVTIFSPDKSLRYQFITKSCTIDIISNDDTIHLKQYGPYFNYETKEHFKKIKTKTQIYFKEITAGCPDCQLRRLEDFKVVVIN